MKSTMITNLAMLALASVGYASFVVETFSEPGCGGEPVEVEVQDDLCASDLAAFTSIKPKSYAGEGRGAVLYEDTDCEMDPFAGAKMFADGTDSLFQEGECLDMGFESQAIGSQVGVGV